MLWVRKSMAADDTSPSVAEDQYNEIISSGETWTTADPETMLEEVEDTPKSELRPTLGARQVQALLEQVTGELDELLRRRSADAYFPLV